MSKVEVWWGWFLLEAPLFLCFAGGYLPVSPRGLSSVLSAVCAQTSFYKDSVLLH